MEIRLATIDDAEALVKIYAPYVEHTAITFEFVPPTVEEFRGRIAKTLEKFPYLVAVDSTGSPTGKEKILGYCYASTFRVRPAYNHCVEMSIYLDQRARRKGVGTALYTEIERRLKDMGIINLCASITWVDEETEWLTHDSIKFHEKMGYKKVAHFHKCGHKANQWFDMIWMEKFINEHDTL